MQLFTSATLLLIISMIISWFLAFISQYLVMWFIIRNQSWTQLDEKERSIVMQGYGLGVFPGILFFLIFGLVITENEEPLLYSNNLVSTLVWIILLIIVGTLGGHIAIIRNQSKSR